MGDVGETYKAMREHYQNRRSERHSAANDEGWEKHTDYHWYRMVGQDKLEYWPSTGRCRFQGKSRNINSKFIQRLIEVGGND